MACQHNTDILNTPSLQGIEGVMHLKTVERGSLSDFKGSDKGAHLAPGVCLQLHIMRKSKKRFAPCQPRGKPTLAACAVDAASLYVQLTSVAQFSGKYVKGERPWGVDAKYDIALPCATQNEVGPPACNTWVMPAPSANT